MRGRWRKVPLGFLIWLVALAIWLTWTPFERRVSGELVFQLYPTEPWEIVGHFCLLIPLAVVLAVQIECTASCRSWGRVWGAVAILGLLLELGQWWIESRSVSPFDLGFGYLGAAFAVWGVAQLRRRGVTVQTILVWLGGVVFTSLLVGMAYGVRLSSRGLTLAGWNSDFMVRAGDEVGGGRLYQGRVWEARVCAGEGAGKICTVPGADTEDRQQLTKIAEASQYIELSAYVWSSTDTQTGPARIVTFSNGLYYRNSTLAQQGRDLIFRTRTPLSGPNGHHPEFVLLHAVPTGIPARVTATFARGVIRMQAESDTQTVSGVFRPGFQRSSIRIHRADTILALFHGRAAVAGTAVFSVSIGLVAGWLFRTRWAVAVLVGAAMAEACLWWVTIRWLRTPPPHLFGNLLAAGGAGFGVILAWWDWNRLRLIGAAPFMSRPGMNL